MAGRVRTLALLLVALAIPSAAFAVETLTWWWTTDADSAKHNPWNASPGGWNSSGGPDSIKSGEKVYIAINNLQSTLAKKYITLNVYAPGAYSKMTVNLVGYQTNDDSEPGTTTLLSRTGSSDTLFTSWILEPQPTWERLELTATEDLANLTWTIEGGWSCMALDWEPPDLTLTNASFAGPGTMPGAPAWTEVWIFPLQGSVNLTPPLFSAPPSSGSWAISFVSTDPAGNPRPGGGVKFSTGGAGLVPGDVFNARISVDGANGHRQYHHLYRYDASTATYTRILLRVLADALVAPDSMMANADGSFHYFWKLYKGQGSAVLGSFGWSGVQNVAGGSVGDCFCDPEFCVMDEGDSLTSHVYGQLTNPAQRGRVMNHVSFCTSPGPYSSTTIRPYTTTAVDGTIAEADLNLRNEPNPFSNRTAFHYALRERGPVRLEIYDLSGRRVATVVDQVQSAGRHSVVWDVSRSEHASGVHFARLVVQGQVRSRRIVITE